MTRTQLHRYRNRRIIAVTTLIIALISIIVANPSSYEQFFEQETNARSNETSTSIETNTNFSENGVTNTTSTTSSDSDHNTILATTILTQLEIKGRAPKTGYSRDEFYSGWPDIEGCSLRQRIIKRELSESATLDKNNCTVISGEFNEPYTGAHMVFSEKSDFSKGLQIDHVVALSDAWQKGAQYMSAETRYNIATDPLNLLAVESKANQTKSDGDAATWLPPNKSFRCAYVARQISVKYKYKLWITEAEHDAMARILDICPNEPAIGIEIQDS